MVRPKEQDFNMRLFHTGSILLLLTLLLSQHRSVAQDDSLLVFTPDVFLTLVKDNHPVSRRASLFRDQARATLRQSRGAFDPKLFGTYDDKYFDKKNYWRLFEGGLKVATTTGITLKTSYAWNDGLFLDPERTIPSQGQALVGAVLPLARGLMIDQRRAAIRQARNFQNVARVEQIRLINDLYWDAAKSYVSWTVASANLRLYEAAVNASQIRFDAVKATFFSGDYAGIDTVEAFTQLQNFEVLRQEAYLNYVKASLGMETFLWSENEEPLEVTDRLRPVKLEIFPVSEPVTQDSMFQVIDNLEAHPDIQKLAFKRVDLEIERRWKAEQLKPVLDLEYNFLSSATTFAENNLDNSLQLGQNYKWGVNLEFPLFLRKERGALALTKLKIQELDFETDQKGLEVSNKIRSYYNEQLWVFNQIDTQLENLQNYRRLLEGEEQKFRAGESTLFLINSRELKLIEAEQKMISLKGKYLLVQYAWAWASGFLWSLY